MNIQELEKRLIKEGCNPSSFAIGSRGSASDAYCLTFNGREWRVYYTERGVDSAPDYTSQSEAEACEYFFNFMMKFRHDHCVGIFKSEEKAGELFAALESQGLHPFRDKIPYGGWSDPRYRVFVSGNEIFSAKEHLRTTLPVQDNKAKGEWIMLDKSYIELNRASRERMRTLAESLTDEQMLTKVGEHWTVAVVYAHIAWWDRRVMYVLDMTEKNGKLFVPEIDIFVNDLSLPLWAAIPARETVRIAMENAEALDQRLEKYPEVLLEEIFDYNKRWVIRSLHRNEHLDEADLAMKNL